MIRTLLIVLLWTVTAQAAVIFETNFDSAPTWNPSASLDACWQNTPIEGGGASCTQTPWTAPWVDANTIWNDYRFIGPACSSINAPHIGGSTDINAVKSGSGFTPYGGSGKSYVHFYENCNTSSGSWGSDGLLGVYFGKTTGYSELYVKAKVKFDPNWEWKTGASVQQKLMHIAHFNEDLNQGVLQAFNWFSYNFPDVVPGLVSDDRYYANPRFYLHSVHTDGTTESCLGPSFTCAATAANISDGQWHTIKLRVKLNSAANVADGIKAVWLDGVLVSSVTNVPFTKANAPTAANYGFNRVVFGGNSNNYYGSAGETQWFSLDNLVVSTTDIADAYEPGGSYTPGPVIVRSNGRFNLR